MVWVGKGTPRQQQTVCLYKREYSERIKEEEEIKPNVKKTISRVQKVVLKQKKSSNKKA